MENNHHLIYDGWNQQFHCGGCGAKKAAPLFPVTITELVRALHEFADQHEICPPHPSHMDRMAELSRASIGKKTWDITTGSKMPAAKSNGVGPPIIR